MEAKARLAETNLDRMSEGKPRSHWTGVKDEFLELVLDQTLEQAGMEVGTLHLLNGDPQHPRNLDLARSGPLTQVIQTGAAIHFHDDHEEPSWRRWLQRHQWRSALLVPLAARDQMVGVLSLGSITQRRELTERELRRVQESAERVAVAIAYDSVVHASSSDLPSLIENLGKLSPSHVLETLLDFQLGVALSHSGAEVAAFLLSDPERQQYSAALVKGIRGEAPLRLKRAVRERLAAIIESGQQNGGRLPPEELLSGLPVGAIVPLDRSGHEYGLLVVLRTGQSGSLEAPRLGIIANEAALLIQKTLRLRDIEQVIFTDPLTGLYTRTYWRQRTEQELDRSRRRHQPVSVIMIDLDFFKKINDSFGHPAGDRVLREVAATLRGSLRKHDVVARYGGEEFIILLPHTNQPHGLLVAGRLLDHIRELRIPIDQGVTIHITASLGFTTTPDGSARLEELVNQADGALYQAKRQGRDQVQCAAAPTAAAPPPSETAPTSAPAPPAPDTIPAEDPLMRAVVARLCGEINNPAMIIMGMVELHMQSKGSELDASTQKVLQLVLDQAVRIGEVTRRIARARQFTVSERDGFRQIELPPLEEADEVG